jgi:hypothetical protein
VTEPAGAHRPRHAHRKNGPRRVGARRRGPSSISRTVHVAVKARTSALITLKAVLVNAPAKLREQREP